METNIFFICFLFSFLITTGGTEAMDTKCKAHFVLVHGYQGGGWVWYKIRTLLEESGYKVSCPDLKSAGIDPTDKESVKTFDDYNQPLIRLLSSIPADEKVVLVGHSAGGLSVIDAIHKFGKKINVAMYVGATMLRQGYVTEEDRDIGIPPDLAQHGDSDMCPEDVTLSSMLVKAGPLQAIKSVKYKDTTSVVDEVKRVYVKTLHDHVLKVEQQAMIMEWPPSDVFVIESDHNPILSKPSDLVKLLVKAQSQHLEALRFV